MHELMILRDLTLILAVALVTVVVLRRLGVPPIAGFIAAGALLGPDALGVVEDVHEVEVLAEIGVVLLLFGIGLEVSFDRLRLLWRPIFVGGTLQLLLTGGATVGLATLAGLSPQQAIFLGCLVALSSTAIVLRGLSDGGEVDAPHGRLILGILVFQDLSVVPMILALPILAGAAHGVGALAIRLGEAVAILGAVILGARVVVPGLLRLVSRTRQRELFVLAVAVICFGTAWLASLAGVSLALGAFLAGMVVASSEFKSQALSDLIPFQNVLTSVFFVSIGMLLDPRGLLAEAEVVGGLFLLIVVGKFLTMMVVGTIMRLPARVTVISAAALSQMGEFSFVLSRAAQGSGLMDARLAGPLTAAVVLTMVVAPLALRFGPHLAAGLGRSSRLTRLLGVTTVSERTDELHRWRDHVVIAGYGLAGERLAAAMRDGGIRHLVVDLNPDNVRRADDHGSPALYGDATRREVLEHLELDHAAELVVVINDPEAAERSVRAARALNPDLYIVVRSRYALEVSSLVAAGASRVIAAESEAADTVVACVTSRHGGGGI